MLQKLRDFLNNSFLWLLFLVGVIAYLFRKEKHLEDQLREQKFDDGVKETKDEQAKIDDYANTASNEYVRLYADYLRQRSGGVQPGSPGSEETDRDQGSKN